MQWVGCGMALVLAACAGAPVGSTPVERWPASLGDVAAAIVALGRHETFTLLAHPLAVPRKGELECGWRDGKLESWTFVDTGAPGGQWWRLPSPPNSVRFGEPDESIVERVVRVRDGHIDDGRSTGRVPGAPTYHAAFLCAQGDLAAYSIGYVSGPLCGQGHTLIMKRTSTGWALSYVIPTWVS